MFLRNYYNTKARKIDWAQKTSLASNDFNEYTTNPTYTKATFKDIDGNSLNSINPPAAYSNYNQYGSFFGELFYASSINSGKNTGANNSYPNTNSYTNNVNTASNSILLSSNLSVTTFEDYSLDGEILSPEIDYNLRGANVSYYFDEENHFHTVFIYNIIALKNIQIGQYGIAQTIGTSSNNNNQNSKLVLMYKETLSELKELNTGDVYSLTLDIVS